jgi:subtilisin
MKKIVAILIAMMLVISVTVVLAGGTATTKEKQSEKVPVIIMFKDKTDKDLIKQHGGELKCVYQIYPAVAVSLPQKAIDALEKNPKIDYIVSDLEVFTMADETLEWGVDRIDADIVHEYNILGTGVKVAIMDTGIDYNHLDLAANYKGGYDFGGIFFGIINDDDPMDFNGHGTHCAGIVAAVRGNGIGVIGVAPEADLYAVKVFDDLGYCFYSDVIEGLEWCIKKKIQVISMSFGSAYTAGDPGIEPWINKAYNKGILLVGAAGNKDSGVDTVVYPARYANVIAVAATNSDDNRASFSSTGPAVELAAPGVGIYSTVPGGYATYSGTSMACPHVAGTAALVIAAESLSNVEVRLRLQQTADYLGAPSQYGYGLVDADEAALPTGNQPPVADANGPYAGDEGSSIEFDGSGSSDLDGTIDSYDWDFGDEATGTGVTTTHAYATAGIYTVTLTVTDDEGATGTDTAIITVTETPTNTMHVASIDMSTTKYKAKGWFTYATATVKIVDANGEPVENANVSGTWTGLTGDSDSGFTDSNGQVALDSDSVKNAHGTFTFTVDGVAKNDWTYKSSANEETSDSITV